CFYPIPDPSFKLDTYLGKWYQVAGYSFRETAGGECITAQYSLNPNGTVRVNNGGRAGETTIGAIGTATPVGKEYGKGGAFVVEFPQGFPSGCPGPNYIVQEYKKGDYSIVQTQNWDTLFILSREQFPSEEKLAKLIDRAVKLGSNATEIIPFSQEGC
ncbi:Calycin-like protein, partial [Sporormia fimetaria CBS 119925]